jgi:hypothetical protein
MGYFVTLKDDVVFAYHESSVEVDIPGDNVIQVESDGEKYLLKKYVNGNFEDADQTRYAIVNNGKVTNVGKTYFSSEVGNNIVINNPDVDVNWSWDGHNFISPQGVIYYDTIEVDSIRITTSETMPATTSEELQATKDQKQQILNSFEDNTNNPQ